MGHTISAYHDVQMKGTEFLRNVYSDSELTIRSKTKVSKIDMLKDIARSLGLDPEKILVQETLVLPHRIMVDNTCKEETRLNVLAEALKTELRKELLQNRLIDSASFPILGFSRNVTKYLVLYTQVSFDKS